MMKRCLNCMEEYEEQRDACPVCGWSKAAEEGAWLEPGTILSGRYILGTVRGESPADILYIGWDAMFARKVLVMEYFPDSCVYRGTDGAVEVKEGKKALFDKGLARFRENGNTLIQMDGTPGLLNVFAGTEGNGTAYLIWEYPGERTLRDVFLEASPYSLEQAEKLVMKLAEPLLAAHRKGLYHGQLSVDRCYFTADKRVLAGGFNDAGFVTGDWEEADTGKPGPQADIFGLAHIVGAALTGLSRWEAQTVDDSLNEMEEEYPSYVVDALEDAMSEDLDRCQENLRRFVDQFLDEATIEMPSNRVYQEEAPRKGSPIWNFLHRQADK